MKKLIIACTSLILGMGTLAANAQVSSVKVSLNNQSTHDMQYVTVDCSSNVTAPLPLGKTVEKTNQVSGTKNCIAGIIDPRKGGKLIAAIDLNSNGTAKLMSLTDELTFKVTNLNPFSVSIFDNKLVVKK